VFPIDPPEACVKAAVKFKKGDTVIYPQHGACIVVGTKKMEASTR
jgi:RNA polymerase-interacting CarD/CdnL/TRCF family regulator